MKTLFKNLTLLIIMAVVTVSCEEAKELADIKLNTTIVEYFDADLMGGDLSTISKTFDINIGATEIEPYLDNLKEVKIKRMTFEVVNFNGDEDASFELKFKGDGNVFLTENFVVSQAHSNGTLFEVSNSNELNNLADKLLNGESVSVFIEAGSDNLNNPIYFKIEAKFYIEVTANPL